MTESSKGGLYVRKAEMCIVVIRGLACFAADLILRTILQRQLPADCLRKAPPFPQTLRNRVDHRLEHLFTGMRDIHLRSEAAG